VTHVILKNLHLSLKKSKYYMCQFTFTFVYFEKLKKFKIWLSLYKKINNLKILGRGIWYLNSRK